MKRFGKVALLVAGALALAPVAQAATVTSGSIGNGRLCTDAACTNVTMNLVPGSSSPVTGTFSINVATLQLEFDLTLGSALLSTGNGADNGITSLTLQTVRYQGTASLVLAGSDPDHTTALPNIWSISGGAAAITGSAIPDATPAAAISSPNVFVGGSCSQSPANVAVCGIIFNPGSYSISLNGATRYLSNTLNVAPEPGTLSLLGVGLAALAGIRFRRS